MQHKLWIIIIAVVFAMVFIFFIVYSQPGLKNPIFERHIPLRCQSIEMPGNMINISDVNCTTGEECTQYILSECIPKWITPCNNQRIECDDGKCTLEYYFVLHRTCVGENT